MAYARTLSVALVGLQGHLVEVEVDLARGLPTLVITGLPDAALSQSRDRVRAAVLNSGESWPAGRITVGLVPAALPKHGSGFDLAVAVAVLGAAGAVPVTGLGRLVVLGELGLDGRVRAVRGVLPAVLAAVRSGVGHAMVPAANAAEARQVPDVRVLPVDSLPAALAVLRGEPGPPPVEPDPERDPQQEPHRQPPDLADVLGQDSGRDALALAAAGGHHLAFFGPPGSGKTMLAERLPGLLPPLEPDEALEVAAVHSIAGVPRPGSALCRRPPFQAPHHTASVAALVGGGSGLARPGALSLAHRGVLFLDEACEFPGGVLDTLRQPLEAGHVVLARTGGVTRYPSVVQLVLATNPCACVDAAGEQGCTCTAGARRRYRNRLSGPLLDRIDLQVDLLPVTRASLFAGVGATATTAAVAARVVAARAAAATRWAEVASRIGPVARPWRINAEVPGPVLRGPCRLPRTVTGSVDSELDRGALSARGYDRCLRLAWSVADLAGRARPDDGDVAEALSFRQRRAA